MTCESARRGFVLPVTLMVIAIMSLSLWSSMSVLEGLRNDLQQVREGSDLEISAASIEGRISFLLATEPLGPRGLRLGAEPLEAMPDESEAASAPNSEPQSDFWFDGRSYATPASAAASYLRPSYVVRIQDQAGLFNLNAQAPGAIERYLAALGVDPETSAHLGDALQDFVDDDNLRRLNGAEADEYAHAQIPPPLNRELADVSQAFGALGWDALNSDLRAAIMRTATAQPQSASVNINTASAASLQGWFGLDAAAAAQVLELRQMLVLSGPEQLEGLAARPLISDDFRLYDFPANAIAIAVSASGRDVTKTYETSLIWAPPAADRPFFWGQFKVSTNTNIGSGSQGAPGGQFPEISGVLADGGRAEEPFRPFDPLYP